jgi:hypothetical protein
MKWKPCFARVCCLVLTLIPAPTSGITGSFAYDYGLDFRTPGAVSQWYSNNQCYSPTCFYLHYPGTGIDQVSSSDDAVGQAVATADLADGEVLSWKFVTPSGSTVLLSSYTWNAASGCFIGSDGSQYCNHGDIATFLGWASINSCVQPWSPQEIGSWSLNTYDNNTLLYSNPFTVSRDPSSFLAITSPTDNQFFQLTNGNYNATGTVQFSAVNGTGSAISWTAQLHYLSSGGYGGPDPSPLNFSGTSYSYSGYQSIGGQVLTTASTTASDGSTVKDCVTFYVEGPESGIPDTTITSQLDIYIRRAKATQLMGLLRVI